MAAKTISKSLTKMAQGPSSPIDEVKKAAAEIESVAQTGKAPEKANFPGVRWSYQRLAKFGQR